MVQPPKSDGTLSFLVVGDWGRRGSYNQSQVARQVRKDMLYVYVYACICMPYPESIFSSLFVTCKLAHFKFSYTAWLLVRIDMRIEKN